MTESLINISTFRATNNFSQIKLEWEVNDPYTPGDPLSLDVVEVWGSLINDLTGALKKLEVRGGQSATVALGQDETWYYWARARDLAGNFGPWSVAVTSGTSAKSSASASGVVTGMLAVSLSSGVMRVELQNTLGVSASVNAPVFIPMRGVIRTITSPLYIDVPAAVGMGQFDYTKPLGLLVAAFDDTAGITLALLNASQYAGQMYTVPIEGEADAVDSDFSTFGSFAKASVTANKHNRIIGMLDWPTGPTSSRWTVAPTTKTIISPDTILPGQVVREVWGYNIVITSVTGHIPYDNTIPQNTEGTVFFTALVTPQATRNFFDFKGVLNISCSVAEVVTISVIRDTGADAIAAQSLYLPTASKPFQFEFRFRIPATDSAQRRYDLRLGAETGTITLRNVSGSTKLGGITTDDYRLHEIQG